MRLIINFVRWCFAMPFFLFGVMTLFTKYMAPKPDPENPNYLDGLFYLPVWMPIVWIIIAILLVPKHQKGS